MSDFDARMYENENENENEKIEELKESFINIENDSSHFNTILVLGLFLVLFSFVYMYGFHGILKFEKNLNYLLELK